jgi:hypothetical protein
MASITVENLNLDDSVQNLSEVELSLQGGGLFKFRKKSPKPDPQALPAVPDILIGFAPFSIF